WNTPFALSPHNPSTIYLGAERLFKSMDRGNTWVMSDDLTRNVGRNDRPIMEVDGKAPMASKHDGAAAYSNIVTISESPVVPGIVIRTANRNRTLMFLSPEYGIYVPMHASKSWKPLMQGMPTVRVDDLVIHSRDRDLIAGTHGRSI